MIKQPQKSTKVRKLILATVDILKAFQVPVSEPIDRRTEKMAMAFLAVADIKKLEDIVHAKDINSGRSMKTRDIISFENEFFQENISSGSYDDIRRKDLQYLVYNSIVLQTSPNSARNDSRRGYALNPLVVETLKFYGTSQWQEKLQVLHRQMLDVRAALERERNLQRVPITLPSGIELTFSAGEHNLLQKHIIEEFLPRYGYGAEVLYVGDTADKYLFLNKEKLADLRFFEIDHGELPDVIAYSADKNWLYLIEAVHSSGPISPLRMAKLKGLTKDCTADLVFVTSFLDRATFRKFLADIAWESEVWIADNPDHLVHFNGDKFLGPYEKRSA